MGGTVAVKSADMNGIINKLSIFVPGLCSDSERRQGGSIVFDDVAEAATSLRFMTWATWRNAASSLDVPTQRFLTWATFQRFEGVQPSYKEMCIRVYRVSLHLARNWCATPR